MHDPLSVMDSGSDVEVYVVLWSKVKKVKHSLRESAPSATSLYAYNPPIGVSQHHHDVDLDIYLW